MTPTAQQRAIYDAVAGGGPHVAVQALAGTGKTTTAVTAAAAARGGRVGFVAQAKHIAEALKEKLNGTAKACTVHSLGFAAVRAHFGAVGVDEGKPARLLRALRPGWFVQSPRGGWRACEEGRAALELARLAKATLSDCTPAALAELAGHYGVDQPEDWDDTAGAVPELLRAEMAETRLVDFDDQIWLPVRLGLAVEQHAVLFVDEAQDLDRCKQELVRRATLSGRLVPVGDRHQSIMGFAGADPEAFPRLTGQLRASPAGCLELPLTVTWRCPLAVVELARRLVPELEARPGAPDGLVCQEDEARLPSLVESGDMVVARRNAPLVTLAFQLLGRGIPVLLRGRDVGKGLLDLVEQLKPRDPIHLIGELAAWLARELEKLERKDAPESQLQNVTDRHDCLRELAAGSPTLDALRVTVERLFADSTPEGKVVLSSIHRAKGLEADRVFITDTRSIPLVLSCRECRGRGSARGRTCPKCKGEGTRQKPWEIVQERNLAYVAVTRAKKELIFAGPVPALLGGLW